MTYAGPIASIEQQSINPKATSADGAKDQIGVCVNVLGYAEAALHTQENGRESDDKGEGENDDGGLQTSKQTTACAQLVNRVHSRNGIRTSHALIENNKNLDCLDQHAAPRFISRYRSI